MNTHETQHTSNEGKEYLSKKVVINGQTVTLYSLNGQTWLSSPDDLPDVMERLENTRILLNDPKGEAAQAIQQSKPTAARYRMKGPKPRPILEQDGTVIQAPEDGTVNAADTEIRVGLERLELVTRAAAETPRSERPTHIAPLLQKIEKKSRLRGRKVDVGNDTGKTGQPPVSEERVSKAREASAEQRQTPAARIAAAAKSRKAAPVKKAKALQAPAAKSASKQVAPKKSVSKKLATKGTSKKAAKKKLPLKKAATKKASSSSLKAGKKKVAQKRPASKKAASKGKK